MRLRTVTLLLVALLLGCEESPTGRGQLALVPEAMMKEMGEKAFTQMKQSQAISKDAAIRQSVQCIADDIVAAARRVYPNADMPATVEVVVFENPTANAFALPGGHIGVHTGILDVARTPAQLAAIIGHEIGHVLANHGNERMTQQLGIKIGLVLTGLVADIESEQLLQVLGLGAHLGIALPFSRAHEREADLMGLAIMAEAGFEPQASIALWRNMSEASGGQPPELLSTHPAHGTRIADLREHLPGARTRFAQATPSRCVTER